MPSLTANINVGDSNRPLYLITVNDPGAEFDSFSFHISPNGVSGLSPTDLDAAVRSFADAVVSKSPTYVLGSITKTSVVETTI